MIIEYECKFTWDLTTVLISNKSLNNVILKAPLNLSTSPTNIDIIWLSSIYSFPFLRVCGIHSATKVRIQTILSHFFSFEFKTILSTRKIYTKAVTVLYEAHTNLYIPTINCSFKIKLKLQNVVQKCEKLSLLGFNLRIASSSLYGTYNVVGRSYFPTNWNIGRNIWVYWLLLILKSLILKYSSRNVNLTTIIKVLLSGI